jgi:hypothetical protein
MQQRGLLAAHALEAGEDQSGSGFSRSSGLITR